MAVAVLGLAACNDGGDAGDFPLDFGDMTGGAGGDMGDMGDMGQGGDMGDMGPVECTATQIFDGERCIDVPANPCELTDPLLGPGCVDVDGDCFPDKCEGAFPAHFRDCDDNNADRRPGLGERCDGIDNNCDDRVDEGLGVGDTCRACRRIGALECAVDGSVACSVEAGQSNERLDEERCNGADDDCDGATDEGCLFELAPADRHSPRWCADRLLWVADGALVAWGLADDAPTVLDDGPVVEPTCDADRDVWLRAEGCDGGGIGAKLTCPAAQLMARIDDVVRPLSPFGALGAPAIGIDGVYLHEGAVDPVLLRAPFDGMPADRLANGVADPTAPIDDLVIARAFRGEQVVMEGVGINQPSRTLDSPGQAPPGRPARDAELIAWIAGEAPVLWVLHASSLGQGLQVGPALGGVPWIAPGMIWWLAPDGLRRFDAATGRAELIDDAMLDPARLWIGPPGRVQLVEEGVRLWPADPERFAEPEPIEPDAGVVDQGVDGDVLDLGVDGAVGDLGVDAGPDAGLQDFNPADLAPADGGA